MHFCVYEVSWLFRRGVLFEFEKILVRSTWGRVKIKVQNRVTRLWEVLNKAISFGTIALWFLNTKKNYQKNNESIDNEFTRYSPIPIPFNAATLQLIDFFFVIYSSKDMYSFLVNFKYESRTGFSIHDF